MQVAQVAQAETGTMTITQIRLPEPAIPEKAARAERAVEEAKEETVNLP